MAVTANDANEANDGLKQSIVLSEELGDDFIIYVDKYIPIDEVICLLNITHYKIVKRHDKQIYDVLFFNDGKIKESRKAIIKDNVLHVARVPSKKKMSFFNVYLNFRLFGFGKR